MGTSKSFAQLAGKMDDVAANLQKARLASFRQAERDLRPVFNAAARDAAGADQVLSGAPGRGRLSVQFDIRDGDITTILYIKPTGPWGIRDNTDVGGPTALRTQRPRKGKWLKFEGDNGSVYAKLTRNRGSRGPYWGGAREAAMPKIRRRIDENVHDAIEAAVSGSGFAARG